MRIPWLEVKESDVCVRTRVDLNVSWEMECHATGISRKAFECCLSIACFVRAIVPDIPCHPGQAIETPENNDGLNV